MNSTCSGMTSRRSERIRERMAEKSAQHLLPVVYQRAFADVIPPVGHPSGAPFAPRVWLIPRGLRNAGKARSPKNAFVATRFYTLRDDDPSAPRIENALAIIESEYGRVGLRLNAREELTRDEYVALVSFVGTLFTRVPGYLAHWQSQYEELERIYRSVERGGSGAEVHADQIFWMKDEMAKRLLFDHADSYGSVVGPGGWLISNESGRPLLAADSPVVHRFLHRDELEATGFPASVFVPGVPVTQRAFFSYCPLSPTLAFVSSPLLVPPKESVYLAVSNSQLVLGLNELSRSHCSEHLLSPSEDPYGPIRPMLRELDRLSLEQRARGADTGARIYTAAQRLWLTCRSMLHEEGPHPLHSRVRLISASGPIPAELQVGTFVSELEMFESGRPVGGMREARVIERMDDGPDTYVLIEMALGEAD